MLLLSQWVCFTNRLEVVSWSCGRAAGVSGPGNTKQKGKSKIQSEVTLLSCLQQKQQKERNELSLICSSVFLSKTEEDQHQLKDTENKFNQFHQLMHFHIRPPVVLLLWSVLGGTSLAGLASFS